MKAGPRAIGADTATLDLQGLDAMYRLMVIEDVFENMAVKRRSSRPCSGVVRQGAVLAPPTPSARNMDPDREIHAPSQEVIGLHFLARQCDAPARGGARREDGEGTVRRPPSACQNLNARQIRSGVGCLTTA